MPLAKEGWVCFSKVDLILMSETLYSTKNYRKLLNLINSVLCENGQCVVASKLYYFGVGGSCFEFKKFVTENSKIEYIINKLKSLD